MWVLCFAQLTFKGRRWGLCRRIALASGEAQVVALGPLCEQCFEIATALGFKIDQLPQFLDEYAAGGDVAERVQEDLSVVGSSETKASAVKSFGHVGVGEITKQSFTIYRE